MFNSLLHAHFCQTYDYKAYTHNYVFSFIYRGTVYFLRTLDFDADDLMRITQLSKASRGAGMALRFRPTADIKLYLISLGAEVLCSEKYFNEVFHSHKYNRGETAEMLITELVFHQTWEKNSTPFTEAGDIVADGIAYQIKHQGATFCNERTLRNL